MLRLLRPPQTGCLPSYNRAISSGTLAAKHELSSGRNPPRHKFAFPMRGIDSALAVFAGDPCRRNGLSYTGIGASAGMSFALRKSDHSFEGISTPDHRQIASTSLPERAPTTTEAIAG
jgi:hypothetical protein